MAGSESKVGPRQEYFRAATGHLGDWVAPIIAFVVVSGIWLAVVCVLFGPTQ
jgi:hypothetical protein